MGAEKIYLFGRWRKLYFDTKGEYIYMPSAGKRWGEKRGRKAYIKDIIKSIRI